MTEQKTSLWRKLRGKPMGILGGILISAGLGYLLLFTALGDWLVNQSYDLPFQRRPEIKPRGVVMVYMDDRSHEVLHQPYGGAWDRSLHARLIRRLTTDHAAAVVFDIIFSDLMNPKSDKELADAIAENGNVILCSDWTIENYGVKGKPTGKMFVEPNPMFNSVAASEGATTLFPDNGEFVRKYKPTITDPGYPEGQRPSEAWAAALVVKPSFNESNSLRSSAFWMNFYCPEQSFPAVSFYKAIDPNDPDVPPGYFSNKVVFVGAKILTHFSGQRKDEYSTPLSARGDNKWFSGVSIHAQAFMNLMQGDYLRRMPYIPERILIICCGVFFGFLFTVLRPLTATLVAVLSVYPIYYADYIAFTQHHYWFAWMIPAIAQIPAALVWGIAYNSLQLYAEKVRVEQSLALYLSPKLVKKFAKDPSLLKPGAEKQLLTILFSDIASFTSISEGMDSDELARLMNEYFQTAVHDCVHATDGTVVKYIGDAIFAFWNAPEPQTDHAARACEAALRFRRLKAQVVNGHQLITRIGLHTGVANVGNFGSESRVDYTAIGENINLASRMEGLNKYLGTRVLITGDTQKEAGERLQTRFCGLFRLKGFEKAVAVYELTGLAGEASNGEAELHALFACGLEQFSKRDFVAAEETFKRLLTSHPKDGPSEFYLDQIAELRETELPAEWKGEITLKDK